MTDLPADAVAFLRLHQPRANDWVEEWRHVFSGAMIRARTKRGKCVTLAIDMVQQLVDAGLMTPSYGGSFQLTDEGKRI